MSITEEQVRDAVSEWVEIYSTYDGDINFYNHDILCITIALRIHNWNIPDCSIELLEHLEELVRVEDVDGEYRIFLIDDRDDSPVYWCVKKHKWHLWSNGK